MKVLFLVAEGYHGVACVFEDYAAEVGFFAEEVLPELGSAATRFESDGFDDFALGEIVDTAPAQEGVVGTVFVVGYNEFLIDGTEPAVGREDFFLAVDNVGGAVVEEDDVVVFGLFVESLNDAEAFKFACVVDDRPCEDAEFFVGGSEDGDASAEVPLPTEGIVDGEGFGEELQCGLVGMVALIVGRGGIYLFEKLLQLRLVVGHGFFVLRHGSERQKYPCQSEDYRFLFHYAFCNAEELFLFCRKYKKGRN